MDKLLEKDIGERIRLLRNRRSLSLRELAIRSGLSPTAISRIERGESSPTVATLRRLANALNFPVSFLFKDREDESIVFVPRGSRERTQALGSLIENLGMGLPDQKLSPFLVTIDAEYNHSDELYSHAGEEFVHCLQGEVEYRVGKKVFNLSEGDSLLFDATRSHCFINNQPAKAKILIILYEPETIEKGLLPHNSSR